MSIIPPAPPRLGRAEVLAYLERNHVDLDDCLVAQLAIRGYRRQSMGDPAFNDFNLYDDAFFWVAKDGTFAAFNGNVDPSRSGWNRALGKPYAVLAAGVHSYRPGIHKTYWAFRQAGPVRVWRDPDGPDGPKVAYIDEGWHGINQHRGGYNSTGSWGCQTVPPAQWPAFKELGYRLLADAFPHRKLEQRIFPYVLIGEYRGARN